jgi:Ca-activated chloride channel family protein
MSDVHFLRPWWLLGLGAAALFWWLLSRRDDMRERWRDIIAPHLLEHLLVDPRRGHRLRPVHLIVASLAIGSLAVAGPAWQRERPPFVEDKAPLAIAIDLSPTMDAIDVTPTRLERVKLKISDLLERRKGGRTAIFAYAGSAHMVLPLTDDAALIRTYVNSLSTGLMPVPGKDTANALKTVDAALAREETPGTILFMTDGVEPRAHGAMKAYRGRHEIAVLGVGTVEGGPVKTGATSFLSDATGGRVFAKLDVDALRAL